MVNFTFLKAAAPACLIAATLTGCGSSHASKTVSSPSSSTAMNAMSTPSSSAASPSTPGKKASLSPTSTAGKLSAQKTSGAPLSQQGATASLQSAAKSNLVSAVKVGGSYEGASATTNTITFWKTDAAGVWHEDGNYPRLTPFSPSVSQQIHGAYLPGAKHAVFILNAAIGGTGSSPKAQAFTRDDQGWGGIHEGDNSEISLTHDPSGPSALYDADFHNGHLRVSDFYTASDNAHGFGVPVEWKVSGSTFTRVVDASGKTYRVPAGDWALFMSPSGKNGCYFQGGSVWCYVNPSAKGSGGHSAVQLSSAGSTLLDGDMPIAEGPGQGDSWAMTTPGLTPPPANQYVHQLPYGDSITDGSNTCKSSTSGFSCSNSAGGFTVNSQEVTLR